MRADEKEEQQGQCSDLKLSEWKIFTSLVNAKDSEETMEIYRILGDLEARRGKSDEQVTPKSLGSYFPQRFVSTSEARESLGDDHCS